jgi:uncharacterized protein YbjT (DUF2867 family)
VRLDYADPTTITPALAGVSAMVLMAPPLDPNVPARLGPVIGAARAVNLQHVVLISAFGVDHNEQAPFCVVEHLVIDSGVPFTILRPNFFMENFSEGSSRPVYGHRTRSILLRAMARPASSRRGTSRLLS